MIKSYLLLAVRNFWKNRVVSLINVAGLSIGISAALVIYLLVNYEFSFDKFHADRNRIYRVVSRLDFPDQEIRNGGVCAPLPAAAKRELTGIEASAAFHQFNTDVKVNAANTDDKKQQVFKDQPGIILANGDYFHLFQYKWMEGNANSSLTAPFQVVLTESRAGVYFPGEKQSDIIGKTIFYNDTISATVSGIVEDFDQPTDFDFKEFVSLATVEAVPGLKGSMGWDEWGSVNSSSQFFVKLAKNVTKTQVEKQLAALRTKYAKDDFMKTANLLFPLGSIHFSGEYDSFAGRQAHLPTLYGLLAVAAFLLLLGCINFINLTTGQAALRAREIGIRKTMGGSRTQLIGQFLGETFLLTVIATIVSALITPGILKIFSDFMPPELGFSFVKQPGIILFIIILIVVVTLLSGFYPAMVLSKFRPAQVINHASQVKGGRTGKAILRKSLTVSQFVIAQFFIIATILVSKQIKYAINKDMGFRKDAIITINSPWKDRDGQKRMVLLHSIQAIPGVSMAALGGSAPATFGYSSTTMKYNNGKKDIETTVGIKYGDADYFKLYQMPLVAGRVPLPNDTVQVEYLINESYARFLGFRDPRQAVGITLDRGEKKIPVSGVLKDFHDKSVHSPIKPLVYGNTVSNHATFHILLRNEGNASDWKNTISSIEKEWKKVYPAFDFNYNFLDQTIASFYRSEQNISKLLVWATALAIFISCLGMLGLVIYTTTQRTREIGVRKVLGATVTQIVALLSKDFLQLVILAFIIAAPLAWWALNNWLESFAYRTAVSWWIFAVGGALMIFIALITLSIQTIRSAIANPVKSLRTE